MVEIRSGTYLAPSNKDVALFLYGLQKSSGNCSIARGPQTIAPSQILHGNCFLWIRERVV
jgi:hypothetical protein